jgi:hypothetical protein
MGEGIFIRTWGATYSIPFFPILFNWRDLILGIVLLVWVYAVQKRSSSHHYPLTLEITFLIIFIILVGIQVPLSWAKDNSIKLGVVFAIRQYAYLPLSAIIWIDIFRRLTRAEAWQLLDALALVTIPFAMLYALSSVGVPIFPDLGWDPITFGSAIIARDFLTFPVWSKLALAYFLTRPRQTMVSLVAIGVLSVSILLSYTRSWVMPAGVMVLISGLYYLIVKRQFLTALTRGIIIISVIAISSLILNVYVPDNLLFVVERLREAQEEGINTGNLLSRAETWTEIVAYVERVNPVFGAGFSVDTGDEVAAINNARIVGDSLWTLVMLPLGWSGIVAMVGYFGIFTILSAKGIFHPDINRSRLALVMFLVMLWDIFRSPVSSDQMYVYPVGFAAIAALIVVEFRNLWVERIVEHARLRLLAGVSLNWFARDDQYWLIRRVALALVVGLLVIQAVRMIVR